MTLKNIVEQKKSNKRVHNVALCDSIYIYAAEEQAKIIYSDKNQKWLPEMVELGWKGEEGTFWSDGNYL